MCSLGNPTEFYRVSHSLYVHIAARERGRLRGWRGWGEGEGVRRGEAMVGQSVVEKYRYIKKLISR